MAIQLNLSPKVIKGSTIVLTALTIVLLIGCILQVAWIRNKLSSIESSKLSSDLRLTDQTVQLADIPNRLSVYGLVVDAFATNTLNSSTNKYYSELKPYLAPRVLNLPYVCDNRFLSLNASVSKAGFLVVKNNVSSERLANDIVTERIKYLVMNSQLLLIQLDNDRNQRALKLAIDDLKIPNMSSMSDKTIFYIYSAVSKHNYIMDNIADASKCAIAIKTFTGQDLTIPQSKDDVANLDLTTIIGMPSSATDYPVHALGYKI